MNKFITSLILFYFVSSFGQFNPEFKKDFLITIKTEFGEVNALLYDDTPLHKDNFIKLAKEGVFDSTTFHRIIAGFMVQGGDPNSKDSDPNNDGQGGPGYTLEAEFRPNLIHKKGAICSARLGGPANPQKRSSGSQFYIVQGKKYDERQLSRFGKKYTDEQKKTYIEVGGTPFLDQEYTVFGEVIKGLDIVDKIASQKKDGRDRPLKSIIMDVDVKELKKKKITKLTRFIYPKQ